MPTIYPELLDYRSRQWSLIPMRLEEKRPACRWKRYQRAPASESTLRRWFSSTDHGIGVIFGEVSQGLASRDFDEVAAYEQWAAANPTLAQTLPTVATRRGRHVYCAATPESVQEARRRLGKPSDATGALHLADGELRAGVGCYSVVPPSTHPSGHIYRWDVPLPPGPLPLIDVLEAGFVAENALDLHPCNREPQRAQKSTEAIGLMKGGGGGSNEIDFSAQIEKAIASTIPIAVGQRHRQVFELCRALRAIPTLADADPKGLRGLVQEWHRRALPTIASKPFTESWIDFLKGWSNVKFPQGEEPMAAIFERACLEGIPDIAAEYEQPELQLLVSVCRELQRATGDAPFYLACRTAGRLLGVDHTTASRWLFLLVSDGVLHEVEKGDQRKRLASRYRYLGQM